MGGSLTDQWIQQWSASTAKWAVETAGEAVMSLLQAFGAATEPSFGTIGPAYNRMLAIGLLLAGAFISLALIEKVLGGPKGAGWEVLPRTLAACMAAFAGMGMVQYGAHYANLLATAWNSDFFGSNAVLLSRVGAIYSGTPTANRALGSAGGMIVVAILTTLLALLIYIELILRAALILVTTTFLPLMCTMAIWPRLAGTVRHLVEFLVALLMSKFVIATAVFVGYALVSHGFGGGQAGQGAPNALITGLATLTVAAFAPLVVLQGIRMGENSAGQVARHWGSYAGRAGTAVVGVGIGARLGSAPLRRVATSVGRLRRTGTGSKSTTEPRA